MYHGDTRPLWELRDITKRYAGVTANNKVNLRLLPGQIHGLLGENGCGKSTLIKMLSGVERPTEGVILKDGNPIEIRSPVEARSAGIATVFQEFSLIPELTVAENIFLGRAPRRRGGLVDWRRMNEGARQTLRSLAIDGEIDARATVRSLSIAQQQLVEIAKAVSANATTLILDEPTAALGLAEIAQLHQLLRRLKASGHAILYVSHRLDEVVSIIDVATILKDGERVAAPGDVEIAVRPIVTAMIGAALSEHFPPGSGAAGPLLLEVEGIGTGQYVGEASFGLHAGEVLGICGVMGSGRTSLLRALFGLDGLTSGTMRLRGQPYAPLSPADAISKRVGLIPENRKSDGLFFNLPGAANATIAALQQVTRRHLIDFAREEAAFDRLIGGLAISPRARRGTIGSLSGGNQQKVVLSRWIFADAEVLLLDEPTQGIDVGAKAAIYGLMRELTARGKAIVLVSSDFEELLGLSDRIAILRNGVLSEALPTASYDEHSLSTAAAAGFSIVIPEVARTMANPL